MRIALKIAYIGTAYHGSQVQPDVKTIEGEIFRALRELNIINDPVRPNYISQEELIVASMRLAR